MKSIKLAHNKYFCVVVFALFAVSCNPKKADGGLEKADGSLEKSVDSKNNGIEMMDAPPLSSVRIPKDARYILVGHELSPVAKGIVPLALLDLRDGSATVSFSMKHVGKVGAFNSISMRYVFDVWFGGKRHELNFDRLVTAGDFKRLTLLETKLDGALHRYGFGLASDADGWTLEPVLYAAPRLSDIKSSVTISSSCPLWDWKLDGIDQLIDD